MSQEITVNVHALPATAVDASLLTPEPLEEVSVGDIVVVYSRGANRLAQVTKVTPKRVEVVYTTKGAWDSAEKIRASLASPTYVDTIVRHAFEAASKNYDYHVRESDEATATLTVATSYRTEERAAAERAEHRAVIEAQTKDEFVAEYVAKKRAQAEADHAEGLDGAHNFVHVTTKNVKRSEVFGIVGAKVRLS